MAKGKFKPQNPSKYKGNHTNIVWRSSWEFKFFNYCDTHSDILEWASEETSIKYRCPTDGKIHRYYPDVILKKRSANGSIEIVMIEIKPLAQTKPPVLKEGRSKRTMLKEAMTFAKNQAKWKAARAVCEAKGWRFQIITEVQLFGG